MRGVILSLWGILSTKHKALQHVRSVLDYSIPWINAKTFEVAAVSVLYYTPETKPAFKLTRPPPPPDNYLQVCDTTIHYTV